MMQWKRAIATKICLFGVLVAVLAGCNDSKSGQANKDPGAFHVEAGGGGGTGGTGGGTGTGTGGTGTGNQKVIADTTIVAGSGDNGDGKGGGDPTPPDGELNLLDILKTTRFTETAPDTIGGATYQSSSAIDYDMGNLVAQSGDDNGIFITPVKGRLRFPQTALSTPGNQSLFPIIVFLHGQTSPRTPSYQGYDYVAEDLAAHGYVVVSIDANASNGYVANDWKAGDESSQSRGQLLLGTLDRLHDINLKGQMDADKNTGPLDVLKGRLDFNRIGVMGHSRGGQGVSNAIKFNQTRWGLSEQDLKTGLWLHPSNFSQFPELKAAVIRDTTASKLSPQIDDVKFKAAINKYNIFYPLDRETVAPYDFKGAFMLAPTDNLGNLGINNVPLAILLPSCDGDVRGLQGAVAYDHNRFGPSNDIAPRYQILVKGANHDYYNTTWNNASDISGDGTGDPHCQVKNASNIRLNAEDQRRGGNFILSSFMRYHVGGEQKFASYWNGMAQLPGAACPMGKAPCDERVVLTIQHAQDRGQLIQRFDQTDSLEYNALGKHTELSGFDAMASCDMPVGASIFASTCSPKRLDDFVFLEQNLSTGKYDIDKENGLRSIADHLELTWSTPTTLTTESKPKPTLTTDLTGLSAKGMDYLSFRLAVVAPLDQEVLVTLTDSVGKTATITASDYSDALDNLPRATDGGTPDDPGKFIPGQVKSLLNMVAIPLKAFQGVDPTRLKELKLTFPKESGKVAITDIELQNFGRDRAEQVFFSRK